MKNIILSFIIISSLLFINKSFAQKQNMPTPKKAVQINAPANGIHPVPTRKSAETNHKVLQKSKKDRISANQKASSTHRPVKYTKHKRQLKKIGIERHKAAKRIDTISNKNKSKNNSPVFFEVTVVNGSDTDGDGYWDAWDFEIDIDPNNGGIAQAVWIDIYDNFGNEWLDIGPYDFNGNTDYDNIRVTDFDATLWKFENETDVTFSFHARNNYGNSNYSMDVKVDLPPDYPIVSNIYIINKEDIDNNGYYELWDFEIDLSPYYGDIADNVYVEVSDNEGNSWGPFGPYDFSGYTQDDNIFINDFGNDFYNFNSAENVNFTFKAYNAYGENENTKTVPVDSYLKSPVLYETFASNTTDADNDGYLEQWSLTIDIDAPGGTAENVYIDINDNQGNDWGTYGPYNFTGETPDDNVTINSWTMDDYVLNYPKDVEFTLYAHNDLGNTTQYINIAVDAPLSSDADLKSIAIDQTNIADFNPNTLNYTITLPYGTNAIPNVTAETNHTAASLQITQASNLNGTTGQRTATINVTAENGTTMKTYSVIFNLLPPSNDATLSNIQVNQQNIQGFSPNTLNYTITLPYGTTAIPNVTATTNHTAASLQITQASNLNGTTGQRTATINVTAENGTTVKTYSVIFNLLPPSNDATLSNIQVNQQNIQGFNPNTLNYVNYVAFSEIQVPIVTSTANNPNATIQINSAISLDGTPEERTTTINVTAEDATTTLTYKVIFNRLPASNNANLSNLTVNGQTIQGFHYSSINYSMELPNGSSVPQVVGTPEHEYAQITVVNATNLNGTTEERTTTVKVTAEDGESIKTYSILFNLKPVVTENIDKNDIKLYPNPAVSELYIKTSNIDIDNGSIIQIFSMSGKLIKTKATVYKELMRIPVSHLSPGVYFILIKNKDEKYLKRFTITK